jgi:nucleoid-associated protein YgaU
MGNFEKLSVLVIVVIIVMILVVALYTWTDGSTDTATISPPSKEVAALPLVTPAAKTTFQIPPLPAGTTTSGTGPLGTIPGTPPLSTVTKASGFGLPPLPVVSGANAPSTPPAPVKPVERVEPTSYAVASGDNATKIVKRQMPGMSTYKALAALERANPGVDINVLRVGQKLTIPGRTGDATADAAPVKSSSTTKASVAPAGSGLKPGTVYVTHRGDTLPGISKRTYGTTERWHEIWLANYAALEDPSMLATGTRLRLPD